MKHIHAFFHRLSYCCLVVFFSLLPLQVASAESFFVDAVVASVNGVPILLSDVVKRSGGLHPKSLSEAAKDQRIQRTLQQLIMEQLLRAETKERRISVSYQDTQRYIQRVAQQNGLRIEEFEQALRNEGKSLAEYREQVEIDILRTKLASSVMRDGITVGETEIDEYMKKSSDYKSGGAKVKLRQIILDKRKISPEEANEKLQEIRNNIDSLESFIAAAESQSQGAEAADGGLLGVLNEEELSRPIFDALFELEERTVSNVVETPLGYHLFFVEQRYVGEEEKQSEEFREEVRTELEKRKMDDKLKLYFAQELSGKFAVDKKI